MRNSDSGGISSLDAANDYVGEFMADYNRRFTKAPQHDFDVHWPLEINDDLTVFSHSRPPSSVKIPEDAI